VSEVTMFIKAISLLPVRAHSFTTQSWWFVSIWAKVTLRK